MIHHHRAVAGVGEIDLAAAAVLAQFQHGTEISSGTKIVALIHGSSIFDLDHVRHVGGLAAPSRRRWSGRCGRRPTAPWYELEVELALETLTNDVEMEQAQEAAAEAEAERGGGFRPIRELASPSATSEWFGAALRNRRRRRERDRRRRFASPV
jgi:hypothetical protein